MTLVHQGDLESKKTEKCSRTCDLKREHSNLTLVFIISSSLSLIVILRYKGIFLRQNYCLSV